MKSKYAVVVVGYNRLNSLKRLCGSLQRVNCSGDCLDLIISLDYCERPDIEEFARSFIWQNGDKKLITHKERLGLRKHILSCGTFLDDYEAIAILEDDIYVSSLMYSYMKQAVDYYKDDDRIAGISLYNYGRNELNGLGFNAAYSRYDTYFIQYAQSWGQIWIKEKWKEFYKWYLKNDSDEIFDRIPIHPSVKKWGSQSWLKYHIAYCIENDKYFVYPYKSMSTCFGEKGIHTPFTDMAHQVPLYEGEMFRYSFADLENNDAVIYDSFFERVGIDDWIQEVNEPICVNLYGDKYCFEGFKYLLTMNKYKGINPIKKYGLVLKPQELNVKLEADGDDIYLYDINGKAVLLPEKEENKLNRWEYYSAPRISSDFDMLMMYWKKLWGKYINKFRRGREKGDKT